MTKQEPELITFRGVTDNSATTGQCSLNADVLYAAVTSFKIPRGMKAKIWARRGVAAAVATQFLVEYTVDGSVWKEEDRLYVAATAQDTVGLEKRRPVVLRSMDGNESFRVSWAQASAGLAYVILEVEICEMDDDF